MFNEHLLKFTQANEAIVVLVKRLEGFIDTEEGSSVKSKSDIFRGILISEDAAKDLLEGTLGGIREDLIC